MFERKNIKQELQNLNTSIQSESNWNKYDKISKDLKKQNYLLNFLNSVEEFEKNYSDTLELLKITDENISKDMYEELENELRVLEKKINTLHVQTLMAGKAEPRNVLVEIHSGA